MIDPLMTEKMMAIAEKFYGTETDPEQMIISQDSADKLGKIYDGFCRYRAEGGEPVSWVLVLPTTHDRDLDSKIEGIELRAIRGHFRLRASGALLGVRLYAIVAFRASRLELTRDCLRPIFETRSMTQFVEHHISEQELLDRTPIGESYDALYLLSAFTVPNHRAKGFAKELFAEAIEGVREIYPIRTLFYWPFSAEGERLINQVATAAHLPLRARGPHPEH